MGLLNFTPRTWAAGEKLTAALLNAQLRDPLTDLQSTWTAFTPTITGSTTDPTYGTTGRIQDGNYQRFGKTVFANYQITFGTGMSAGSGTYNINLPVAPDTTINGPIGSGFLFDSSALSMRVVSVRMASGLAYVYMDGVGSAVYTLSATNPWTWAAGDQIGLTFFYQAA